MEKTKNNNETDQIQEILNQYDLKDVDYVYIDNLAMDLKESENPFWSDKRIEEIIYILHEEKARLNKYQMKTPPIKLEDYGLSLPIPHQKIYFYLFDHMNTSHTVKTISRECNFNVPTTQQVLDSLVQGTYIKEVNNHSYKLDDTIPQLKADHSYHWKPILGSAYVAPCFQYHLLCDNDRVLKLKEAIEKRVKKDDVVLDLGAGSGLLAQFAAKKAKKVYAIEENPFMVELGKSFINQNKEMKEKIHYIEGDARYIDYQKIIEEDEVDVVICELVDTALIREHQIPVMNHVHNSNILKRGGMVIPYSAVTQVQLVQAEYELHDNLFPLPFYEEYGARDADNRSKEKTIHDIKFTQYQVMEVEKKVDLKIIKNGGFNAFRLTTYVLAEKDVKMKPSKWFNPPLVFPLIKPDSNHKMIPAVKSESVELFINYRMGDDINYITYGIPR